MTEGSKREDVTVDRKHGGPPKVGDKSPKVGGPFEIGHNKFRFFIQKSRLREGTGNSSNGTVHLEGGYGWVGRVSLGGLQ